MFENWIFWLAAGYLSGSLPFSVWLGQLLIRKDVRAYGDHNPGTVNAWRAGGPKIGIPVLLLDYLKGAVPVFLASYVFGISGWQLVPVAIAPVAGHAYSIFLTFKGGKAITTSFGIWTGVTLWEAPTFLGLFLGLIYFIQLRDSWNFAIAMFCLLVYLIARQFTCPIVVIWAGNMLIFCLKGWHELRLKPSLRPWLIKYLQKH
jgi:glycerol-3-phosphate acyltransferase PlsY